MPEDTPANGSAEVQAGGEPGRWGLGFWSLIATQFQGAFNDNALKFLVIFLIIGNKLSPMKEN